MAGGVPVMVETFVEHDFQVTGTELEAQITPRTKAILMSYPNNPTGAILTPEHMQQVADGCVELPQASSATDQTGTGCLCSRSLVLASV